jgi:FKBP-type peptidyl-prolyl cis-trans isomerase
MKSSLFIVLCLIVGFGCDKTTPIIPAAQRLEQDIATIDEYLATNNITAVKDTTGLRYVIHSQGTGVMATTTSCVKATYKGSLLDGTVFDENTTGIKTYLSSSSLIYGWRLGFSKLARGAKATFYIPSGYGYGTQSQTKIPANSILVFDVELLEVYAYNATGGYCYDDPMLTDEAQNAIDIPLIDQYLAQNNITAQVDASGLRYVVNTLGTGAKPTLSNCVRVSYTGKLLTGSVFDQSTNYKAPLKKLIQGWQKGLPLFPKGSKVTLYIPSRMGYGPQSVGSKVPANANLVFDIEILDVTDYNATSDICN